MRRFSFTLLALLISLTASLAAAGAPQCGAIFSEVGPRSSAENAQALSTKIMTEMRATSNRLHKKIQTEPEVFDVVCLGAGAQCAAASLVLGRTDLSSLVVERSSTVASNFEAKSFQINSSETRELSMHEIPGSLLSFDQITTAKYATSTELATYIQAAQYQSKVPVLLNTEVISVRTQGDIVILKTKDGNEIKTRRLLVGTGLGEASTKVADPIYSTSLASGLQRSKIQPTRLQKYMNTETFMKSFKGAKPKAVPVEMPSAIAMIGSGDGARIAIEKLANKMTDPSFQFPKDFKIYWIGSKDKSAADYVESQKGWDRYLPQIVPLFEKGIIQSVPGYGQSVRDLTTGKIEIKALEPESKVETTVTVDMLVDNTGYENKMLNQLLKDFPNSTLKDEVGSLPGHKLEQTILARSLVSDGAELPIHFLGAAAGPLASKTELQNLPNRNPVSIYNNAPRTSAFVAQTLGVKPPQTTDGRKLQRRPPVLDAQAAFMALKKLR